jgi:acyl transferase domain-containing protein
VGDDTFDYRLSRNPIAIVGLAGMFPSARDVREFWRNIVTGTDCTEEVPASRFRLDDHFDPDPFAQDKTYCRRGGFLPAAVFDPLVFGMPPTTVDATGLIQLLSLQVAKEALRDAGCEESDWYRPARTGVVLGVCGGSSSMMPLAARLQTPQLKAAVRSCGLSEADAEEIARRYAAAFTPWTENSFPGFLGNVVSGRIANRLNLGAYNGTVDAACASSLAALRTAVDELAQHRADLMLTGGCDADNTIFAFMCFSKTPALSMSSRISPFDEDADGTLVGEGIGILALKRLADAERDGDRVYAVIRGLGSSSDGRAQSIFAPSGAGQLTALRRAYEDADCPPDSVGLIEAHGTGTRTGDDVELDALNTLMATPGDRLYAAVGSVKSQIGHTKAAAGAASLIKTALALHHKLLPPTINVRNPSAAARRADAALYINTETRPWIRDPRRPVRRAGVSAFGFGGVNLHTVLEEYAPQESSLRVLHPTPRACLWHAPSPEDLRALLEDGAPPDDAGPVPADHARLGFVLPADNAGDAYAELLATAVAQLRASPGHQSWSHARGIWYRAAALPPEAKVAALFSGQGSQYVGMGRDAVLAIPPVRAAFDAANALFTHGDTLADVVYPVPDPAGRDPRRETERLRATAYAQPAIAALTMGQYRYLADCGFAPHGALGHSFGELSALWAAGCFDDADFLRTAHARGAAMAPPRDAGGGDAGAMAALRTSAATAEAVLAGFPELAVCARNTPDECVAGGPTPAIERLIATCAAQRISARRLPVAAAFHTPLVQHAVDSFAAAIADVPFGAPAFPVYANTRGARYGSDPAENRRVLTEQILHPVDFRERLEEMYANGCRIFVEFGPKQVLSQFVARTLGGRDVEVIGTDIGTGGDSALGLKQAAVRLAVLGLPIEGIDRYDAPPAAERPAPSKVARTLDGPNFAMAAREEAYRRALDKPYQAAVTAAGRALPGPADPEAAAPQPVASASGDDLLSRAAADHLAMHTLYLDGQLRTAEHLVDLLREGANNGHADAILAGVNAARDHSLALGQAHVRANEVLSDLLRLETGGAATAVPAVVAPAKPLDAGPAEAPPMAESDSASREQPGEGAGSSEEDPRSSPAEGAEPTAQSSLALLRDADMSATQNPELRAALAQMDSEEAEAVLREIVAEKTGYSVDMIDPDADLQMDLGIDSLKQVEIAAALWQRYPVFSREEIFRFAGARTVRDLAELLPQVLTSQGPLLTFGRPVPLGRRHVGLRELPGADVLVDAYGTDPSAVLVDDGGELARALGGALAAHGWRVCRLILPGAGAGAEENDTWSLGDWAEETLAQRVAEIGSAVSRLDLCVLPVSRRDGLGTPETVRRLAHAVLVAKHVRQPLEAAAAAGLRAGFVTVTQLDGALGYSGSGADPSLALSGGLGGLVKSLALEALDVYCRALDLAPELSAQESGDRVIAEISDSATDLREVGHDGDGRRTPDLLVAPPRPVQPPAATTTAEVTGDDLLLVTGGARGITSWCVKALAAQYPCRYLLLGRTPLTGPEAPAHSEGEAPAGQEHGEGGPLREIRSTLRELRAAGVDVEYVAADVGDTEAVRAALAPYADRVSGVIHGAGVLADQFLADKGPEDIARVVSAKLTGLDNVLTALDPERLRHLVLFTSVSGIHGNARQTDYSMANEALNRFACAWKARYPVCRVAALAWGPWAGGMASPGAQEIFVQHGVPLLTRETGTGYFVEQMSPGHADDLVTVIGPVEPVYRRRDALPKDGLVVERRMAGLAAEPVLDHHRIHGTPVLPITAAVGWCVHTVESARGGQPVVECRDFRIGKGVVFDGSESDRFLLTALPAAEAAGSQVTVTIHSEDEAGRRTPRYEGTFVLAEEAPRTSPIELPALEMPPFDPQKHEAYRDFLFHGPVLRGLGPVLEEEEGRLVIAARMAEPVFAHGAFSGALYSAALADLLLQAAALLARQRSGALCLPMAAARVELFEPLPDDVPFLLVAESVSESPLLFLITVTACTPDGRVLQRWSEITMLVGAPELAEKMGFVPPEARHG